MDANDVKLISDLAESIRQASPVQKERQAAELITHLIASQPDAVYFLVQTVLVQREALAAGAASAQGGSASGPAPASGSQGRGLFGLLGGRQQQAQPSQQVQAQPSGGVSFLRSAAAGAAGVAGGILLAQGIGGLFHDASAADHDADRDDSGWEDDGYWDEA
ncbi:DUF2076 family protein [Leifsonia shinshuensis]|uniref:DUF2076 domain-containing protein n=1 Tax=Leifsonia shinshuensis TaxID=150026 RepID=A0A853CQR2_9MICO|nr:DUF2076 family protein [Leifsonia shinshuensis]NYJ22263.1 hypothetical protein [Leifsonia shinshuensis]